MKPRLVARSGDCLGEGPLWDLRTNRLYWFDILARRMHALEEDGTVGSWVLPVRGSAGAVWGAQDLLVAGDRGLHRFQPSSGSIICVADLGVGAAHRTNDGKCDPEGRFWISTMHEDAAASAGCVHCVQGTLAAAVAMERITVPNGLAWSPDGRTVYWADSAAGVIYSADFADGARGAARVFARVDNAVPDGAATDVDGYLWSAHWDGWRVVRYAPDGTVDRVVEMPVCRPTSCAFGGRELRTLYVTSARYGLDSPSSQDSDLDGCLFALDVGVPGTAVAPFADAAFCGTLP